MGVRVWGAVDDRLVEVSVEPAGDGAGLVIEGLPPERVRPTRDRIRAALVNAGVVLEAPDMTLRLDPPIEVDRTDDLDLPLALAVLARAGLIRSGLRWIYARGRLGLDGSVSDAAARTSLPEILEELCQWGL